MRRQNKGVTIKDLPRGLLLFVSGCSFLNGTFVFKVMKDVGAKHRGRGESSEEREGERLWWFCWLPVWLVGDGC